MCGKGVDQTMRTPQRWQVLALELKERHCMGNEENMGFELGKSFFTDKINFDVWGALARPAVPVVQQKKIEPGDDRDDDYPWRRSLGIFDILSNELVDMVIDNVSTSNDNDLVALGLTCQGFWELVVQRIQTRYIKNAAPWAGKKIALLGSWSTSLPESFSQNNLASNIIEDAEWPITRHLSRTLFCLIESEGTALRTTKTREASLMNTVDQYLAQCRIPEWRWKEMKEQLKCPELFPLDREWVLRNLTTREYVSASYTVGVIRATKIRLVDALLSKIGWSDNLSWSDQKFDEDGWAGQWAGHCFDIVTKEVQVKEGGSEAWKNVTDDVVRQAEMLR
ncbi:hypothetical protein EG329_002788 [Mollisiaceae sp. DMI_Dod_QoI]|nr:hypothetical protein EG329_002788 [Helotiales sp. DMI_Dod_QoI]